MEKNGFLSFLFLFNNYFMFKKPKLKIVKTLNQQQIFNGLYSVINLGTYQETVIPEFLETTV